MREFLKDLASIAALCGFLFALCSVGVLVAEHAPIEVAEAAQ